MFGIFGKDNNYSNNIGYDSGNSNLQLQFNNLKSQYDNAILNTTYQEKEYKKLKSMVENLCKSILSNEYNYNQLGGNSILKDMDVYKLIEFTTGDYMKQKLEQKQIIDKLMQQTITQSEIIKTLKEQLTQTMIFNNTDLSKEDVEGGTIINNTSSSEMNVFENNDFSMQDNNDFIASKVQGKIEKTGSKKQFNVDLFGNIIDEHKEVKKEEQKREEFRNVEKQTNSFNSNPQKTNRMVDDPNSKIASIFGSTINNNNNKKEENTSKPNTQNNNRSNSQEQQPSNNIPKLTIENVDSYMDAMTPIMWDVLEVMGVYGYSTSNDILDEINKDGEKYKKGLVLNTIASLTKMNVISAEQISTGFKRFKILKMTNKGFTMFKAQFNKEPIESEIDKIIRDHDNVVHGYTIRDAKDLMINVFNCTDVSMDRQKVSIKLPNGKTYIPDIVAVNTVPKKYKMYLEVELGNTPQSDFNDKCSKMVQVTKHLYFIADVEDTKRKLENQVSLWVLDLGGKEKVAGVTIYITTMTQLSKGDWSRVLKY